MLEKLCSHIKDGVGAIAGAVLEPGFSSSLERGKNTISTIYTSLNYQWYSGGDVIESEHLYSSFLYRKTAGAHGYCKDLSTVGHREETIFTYEMFTHGWKLIIDPNIITWHMKENSGGIRSFSNKKLWENDEEIFRKKLLAWKSISDNTILVNMDCGIGDHFMFKPVLKDLISNNPEKTINVAACFKEVFMDLDHTNVKYLSIADAKIMYGKKFEELNVYKYCMDNNWKDKPLVKAFKQIYLKDDKK